MPHHRDRFATTTNSAISLLKNLEVSVNHMRGRYQIDDSDDFVRLTSHAVLTIEILGVFAFAHMFMYGFTLRVI